MITENVIKACGLVATGMTRMHGVSSSTIEETFLVNIYLPNHVAYSNARVARGYFLGGDILIGMDIITIGDFAITSPGGVTQFSFRVPSIGNIDFVKETNVANKWTSAQQSKGPAARRGQPHRRPKHQRKNKRKR